jgi:hypothetical protein
VSSGPDGRPDGPVLTDATVIVMNKQVSPEDGQGMIAISSDGCFYMEGQTCAAISLDELEKFFDSVPSTTDDHAKLIKIIKETIRFHRSKIYSP